MCKKKLFEKNMNFGLSLSPIDGTEHIFGANLPLIDIPEEYSYKDFMPAILNQGAESICVPCSLSTYLNWRENLADGSKKDNKIDYHEIYGIKTTDGEGMTFKEAFHYLRHHGVSSKAGNLKINEYALVKNYIALKLALIMNGACLGALPVYNDRSEFWKKLQGDGFYGYHAISIVGFDKNGFIIRNSWGTGFGKSGYTVLKYEDFATFLELWTIVD